MNAKLNYNNIYGKLGTKNNFTYSTKTRLSLLKIMKIYNLFLYYNSLFEHRNQLCRFTRPRNFGTITRSETRYIRTSTDNTKYNNE